MFLIDDDMSVHLTRGDSATIGVEIRDTDGEIYDLQDGDVVKFTVRKNVYDRNIVMQKTGLVFTITNEDTRDLPYGKYVYDVELSNNDTNKDTFITPTLFEICPEVTW